MKTQIIFIAIVTYTYFDYCFVSSN